MTEIPPTLHGTLDGWAAGCRNSCCSRPRRRKIRRIYGTDLLDAAPAAAHLTRLQSQGFSIARIAAEATLANPNSPSISATSLTSLLCQRPRTHRSLASAVLRVTPETLYRDPRRLTAVPGGTSLLIDSAGTCRRIQALAAAGWSYAQITATAGLAGEKHLIRLAHQPTPVVRVRTAAPIAAAFEELQNGRGTSARSLAHAAAGGWLLPWWWEEDTIDDPAHDPEALARRAGSAARERRMERRARAVELSATIDAQTANPYSAREVAERLGLSDRTVVRYLQAHRSAAGVAS